MSLTRLPSGAVAPLETPGLPALLSGDGTTAALAAAAFAHEEVDVSQLTEEDCYWVALRGLTAFSCTDEALLLTLVCREFGEAPSARLRVADRVLAFRFDSACQERLAELRGGGLEEDEERDGLVRFGVPDPWEGE